MAVTIRDVAQRAGVSFKTVSNVVNDFPHVAPATRAKVLAAIDELGYRPNQAARHLRQGTSGFLALVLPEIANPYFSTLASLVGHAAKEEGWDVVVEETGADSRREQEAVDQLSSRLVDGVIFSPVGTSRELIESRIGGTPMVLLGEWVEGGATDHVGIDNVAAARQLTEHVLASGARRIGLIGYSQSGVGTGGQRWLGHVAAHEAAGIPVDPALVAQPTGPGRAGGAAAMRELLVRDPQLDAVLAINDMLAVGAHRALHEAGLAVPGDVLLAGFDDTEEGRFSVPSLTSVAPDVAALARAAVTTVLRRIKDPAAAPTHIRIPHTIATRESSAP